MVADELEKGSADKRPRLIPREDLKPVEMLRQPRSCDLRDDDNAGVRRIGCHGAANPMASSYQVDNVIVAFGMSALVLAITVDRLLNGLSRPFWGWVSDRIGRENAIFIAFVLEGGGVLAAQANQPSGVVCGVVRIVLLRVGRYFFAVSLDLWRFIRKQIGYDELWIRLHSERLAALFAGPGAAWLFARTGSWSKVFWAMIACDLIAAFMALLWLKPLAARVVRKSEAAAPILDSASPIKARSAV